MRAVSAVVSRLICAPISWKRGLGHGASALSCFLVAAVLIARASSPLMGRATVIPSQVRIADWSSLELVYQVGSSGIAERGGIQVQFPKSWHPWLPTPAAPQTTDEHGDHYVTAHTSRPGVTVTIGIANVAIDGRTDRMDWTATLTVSGDSLSAGDEITYTFGDQSGGGRGFQAHYTAMVEVLRVAEDPEGDGTFVEYPNPPRLTLTAWSSPIWVERGTTLYLPLTRKGSVLS